MAGARTGLFARNVPGGVFTIVGIEETPGALFFVHSGTGTDEAGAGSNPDAPVATIDYAIALCTADKADVIYVMPGHNEDLGNEQIDVDKAGVSIIGLGRGSVRPRVDFGHANSSINIQANGCAIRNIQLLPAITDVLVAIDVEAAVTDTLIEDVEALPGEDAAGVDDFALVVDIKAGCSRTEVSRLKVHTHASAAGYVAGVSLTGASDDCFIHHSYINIRGAGVVAPINAITTLSTNLRIIDCILVADAEPGIEVITLTTGVISNVLVFADLGTIAAAVTGNGGASSMAQHNVQYIEVGPESGEVVGTPSVDD